MLTEFGLIDRYFKRPRPGTASRAVLGIGDDCALLAPTPGLQWAISTDMLVSGRHFFADVDPAALGHKALAVNLSDLAAMGAQARAFTLALALPQADPDWLQGFSDGLFALADSHGCELIGGDTTGGPLNICITVFGEIEPGQALTRGAAQVGDDIWISGQLGDARLALGAARGEWQVDATDLPALRRALERPQPRLALGRALRGIAHAALDLSDGLAGDLRHILRRSGCAARVDVDALPRSAALARQPLEIQRRCTVAGGDDYELCFTAPPAARDRIAELADSLALALTRVGTIEPIASSGGSTDPAAALSASAVGAATALAPIHWVDGTGRTLPAAVQTSFHGFDHFDAS